MTRNFRLFFTVGFLVFAGFAQENIFLQRNFWNASTSIQDVKAQLQAGHDISALNANKFDAVVYAILQNTPNKTIAYVQSQKGNDVNKLTHDGRTYLFWAAYKGNVALMNYFIQIGAKTHLTDDAGYTVLNFAAATGQTNTNVYEVCLNNGANLQTDLSPNGANALLLAAPFDTNFNLINYFVSKGVAITSTDYHGNGLFNYAAKTGNRTFLNALLKKDITGTSQAFIFAVSGTRNHKNNITFYKYLEGLGLDPNVVSPEGNTPLHILAKQPNTLDQIQYFINKGVPLTHVNNKGNTAFFNAVTYNSLPVISSLYSSQTDLTRVNKQGVSALALALEHNSYEVVAYLIKSGAPVGNKNQLIYDAMKSFNTKFQADFEKKMALLVAHGADINSAQANGNTVIHNAVMENNLDLLKWAMGFDVNINAKNEAGNTALHLAAMRSKNTDILKYLIAEGADTSLTTAFQETAFQLAQENELLTSTNADILFLK
ncbi:ankyrin repeat domain-containing protein [Bizionia sediminis]|uniref:Ankyrin repeat domain-containing protein n=1 Tax=Bizionia sediminis TaxID=1737064 RepID=A0ABW5KUZ9_9FLAO